MSDLDLPGSVPTMNEDVFEEKLKMEESMDNSQTSVLTSVYKEDEADATESSPNRGKKTEDAKLQHHSLLMNAERYKVSYHLTASSFYSIRGQKFYLLLEKSNNLEEACMSPANYRRYPFLINLGVCDKNISRSFLFNLFN